MGVPGNANALLLRSAAAAGGYQVSRSLRFSSGDSSYLSRTPASAGNRKTWTWSGWVKRSVGSTDDELFSSDSSDGFVIRFVGSTSAIRVYSNSGGGLQLNLITSAVYRDPSAWYHLVVSVDTTQATASDRAKIYVNGTQVTAFSTAAYPSQNTDLLANQAIAHFIGKNAWGVSGLNGYLADIHFIDGQALTPSSFTEVSATTGQLLPRQFTGSFGTNGFWLKFSDNSAATATTLGKDYSGNGNNWTPNNLSVTAGAGNDSLTDTPTSYGTDTGAGGEVRGNYCVINPLDNGGGLTLSNGNLEAENTAASSKGARCTIKIPSTGKWYFEGTIQTLGGSCALGVATSASANPSLSATGTWHILNYSTGIQSYPGGRGYTFTTAQVGNVLQVAYDADSGKLWFGVNNTWCDGSSGSTGNPGAGTNPTYTSVFDVFPAVEQYTSKIAVNFGQRPFAYTAPSGFKALCDTNLTAPVVAKPSEVMDVKLYTGNGSTQTISGLGFSPDLVWIKSRTNPATGIFHTLYDSVRGQSSGYHVALFSNSTDSEDRPGGVLSPGTSYGGVTTLNSNGFSLANGSVDAWLNINNTPYVAWTWDAGSSTVTNTQGSITSQVRANASAGFSIVTYTVSTSSQTAGHGLGVTPSFVLCKRRNGTSDWYFQSVIPGASGYLLLNSTAALTSASYSFNSTTFQVAYLGGSGEEWVAYCFAPVAGYSSFGTYTGGGSSGRFVYTGFRPKLIWVKNYNDGSYPTYTGWYMWDSARGAYNYNQANLNANSSNQEGIRNIGGAILSIGVDFLSNGFCLRGPEDADTNWSSGQYIYCAWAESPFQYARAR